MADEFRGCLEMTQLHSQDAGLNDYRVRLSFRDPGSDKYVGATELWNRAEAELESVCRTMDLPHLSIAKGEAAFYGPKRDSLWRIAWAGNGSWWGRCSWTTICERRTVRPGVHRRGQPPSPPVMIHRAPLGFAGAVHGCADRALCGAFPFMAGARAGPRDVRQPEIRAIRPARSRTSCGCPGCASAGITGRKKSAPKSARRKSS